MMKIKSEFLEGLVTLLGDMKIYIITVLAYDSIECTLSL